MQTALVALVLAQLAVVEPSIGAGPRMPDPSTNRCAPVESGAPASDATSTIGAHTHTVSTGCISSAQRPVARRIVGERNSRDEWFAVDKVQHFAMAYGTAMFGYGVLRGAGASHGDAQAAALAGSLAAGLGKELFDRARGGPFSLKDLTWDALGTLAAWGLLSLNR